MSLIDETKRGNVGQVIALLSSGRADPNMSDTKGNTALHHAVDKGYVEIIRVLIQHNADPNLAELEHLYTPLHRAAIAGSTKAVEALLASPTIDVDRTDKLGKTAQDYAKAGGRDGIVGMLAKRSKPPTSRLPLARFRSGGKPTAVRTASQSSLNTPPSPSTPVTAAPSPAPAPAPAPTAPPPADVTPTAAEPAAAPTPPAAVATADKPPEPKAAEAPLASSPPKAAAPPAVPAKDSAAPPPSPIAKEADAVVEAPGKSTPAVASAPTETPSPIASPQRPAAPSPLRLASSGSIKLAAHEAQAPSASPPPSPPSPASPAALRAPFAAATPSVAPPSTSPVAAYSGSERTDAAVVPLRSLDAAAGARRHEKRSSVTSLSNEGEPAPAPPRTHPAAPEKTSSRNKLFSIAKKSSSSAVILGPSPLVMAAKAGDYDEVERRLVAGEDVNSRDRDGCTVMYYAAEQGNVQAMARLIERHADVNLANEAGWTPLHAVVCGTQPDHEVCLGMLLHEGANLRAATKNGETPLQLAQRRNAQPGILQLLQRATLSASVKLLRQLADYPGSTLDADKATALHMVLRQYDEMQADLEKSRRVIERLEAAVARVPAAPASAPAKAANEAESPASQAADAAAGPSAADDAAGSPLSASATRSQASAAAPPSRGDRLVEEAKGIVASTAPAKLSTCFDCIQHRREIAQLKEERDKLAVANKKLSTAMAKNAVEVEAKVASLEQRIAQAERERDEAVDARIKEVQRIETVYSNKVSKVMQETEGVLRQVHIDLDEADRARQDLLLFQLKKKKLTWVPDQLVAACQGQGCGRVFEQRVRKHHCRCCGRVFCKACTRERAAIPQLNFKSLVRVCDSCSMLLLPGNPSNPFPGTSVGGGGSHDGDGSDEDDDA